MNPESSPSKNESGISKKAPVSELLSLAGESFDTFGDKYTKTHDSKLLVEKNESLKKYLLNVKNMVKIGKNI